MSLHQLDVAPRDVAADALGLLLDAPAPVALAEATRDDGDGGRVILGVLGASHIVTATLPGHRLTEQVSCDALAAGGCQLPRRVRSGGYRMSSATSDVAFAELNAMADRLRALAEDSDAWLCGAFPGADGALTAMTASATPGAGWTWETWHLYPGEDRNVIVTTRSRWTP